MAVQATPGQKPRQDQPRGKDPQMELTFSLIRPEDKQRVYNDLNVRVTLPGGRANDSQVFSQVKGPNGLTPVQELVLSRTLVTDVAAAERLVSIKARDPRASPFETVTLGGMVDVKPLAHKGLGGNEPTVQKGQIFTESAPEAAAAKFQGIAPGTNAHKGLGGNEPTVQKGQIFTESSPGATASKFEGIAHGANTTAMDSAMLNERVAHRLQTIDNADAAAAYLKGLNINSTTPLEFVMGLRQSLTE